MERHIHRFQYWVLLTLFAIVNLTSLTNVFKENEEGEDEAGYWMGLVGVEQDDKWTKEQRWVISVAVFSLILSLVACLGHLVVHDKFSGKPIERVLVRLYLVYALRCVCTYRCICAIVVFLLFC